MTHPVSPLGELCEIVVGRTPARANPNFWGDDFAWLSIADMGKSRLLSATKEKLSGEGAKLLSGRRAAPGTVLLSFKLSIGKVGIAAAPMFTNEAIASLPIRDPSTLLPEYLARYLEFADLTEDTNRAAMGQTLNLPMLRAIEIPVPPISEQRRIAVVLDQADELRTKRRRALALLDELADSLFIEMFEGTSAWPYRRFEDVLAIPLRNGISPSTTGTVKGRVLTLGAITHGKYDASASKDGTFERSHDESKLVAVGEMLICRGNGNQDLVGRGELVDEVAIGALAFPDTMIAARFDKRVVVGEYVRAAWSRPRVRVQIRAGARTTNGTFKVNQQTLNEIEFPVPPLQAQQGFALRIKRISSLRNSILQTSGQVDELFASLQHRAFRGEL